MNIKNFKINQKILSRVASFILAGSTILTLAGCSKNSVLEGTILNETIVFTFDDGTKDIGVFHDKCRAGHIVYKSIINDTYFSDEECNHYISPVYTYDFFQTESITSYLTKEELELALKHDLDEAAIANIIDRALSQEKERVRE